MKISVITATYNCGNTLETLAAQTYPEIEHLVMDGGSKDDTLDLVRAWPNHPITLESGNDKGTNEALNMGVAKALGEVVGFLHAADVLKDGRVLKKIAGAFEGPMVQVVPCAPRDLSQARCLRPALPYRRRLRLQAAPAQRRRFEGGVYPQGARANAHGTCQQPVAVQNLSEIPRRSEDCPPQPRGWPRDDRFEESLQGQQVLEAFLTVRHVPDPHMS